jgi:hypothetical protein
MTADAESPGMSWYRNSFLFILCCMRRRRGEGGVSSWEGWPKPRDLQNTKSMREKTQMTTFEYIRESSHIHYCSSNNFLS